MDSSEQVPQTAADDTSELLARLATKSAQRRAAFKDEVTAQRWSYREAAAVLHCFDPEHLRPNDPRLAVERPRTLLAGDTQPAAGGRDRGYWTLTLATRRAALSRLGSVESLRAALAANPDRPRTDVQEMLESFLGGSPPNLVNQSSTQLSLMLQVVSWLQGFVPQLPTEEAVRAQIARRAPLRRFEHLVSQEFVGRQAELGRLRDYVGVLPPNSVRAAIDRQLRDWLKLTRRPPLLLHGPGGIGKSALVGRFLFEHSQAVSELRFPFAYLPFDDPLLVVNEPYTLLQEAAEQLAAEYPDRRAANESFRESLERFSEGRVRLSGRAAAATSRGGRLDQLSELEGRLIDAFGVLLGSLAGKSQPALFVLDTFEEVQYRPPAEVRGLAELLTRLQGKFPLLRVVASGRAPARELAVKTEELALGDLDPSSAEQLLRLQGVSDAQLAAALVSQFGGNPLTLKLAAEAIRSHPELAGESGVSGIATRRYWFFSIPQELIQGQLYRRVLDHIRDERVRKLAHPGMVLRRVTPAIIARVLSVPCGVPVPDLATATELFEALRQEHALVRLEDADTLLYRPEVRQPMLRLLERDAPAQVRDIHRLAVEFWQETDDQVARAEELYHRLALDQEPWELERWWSPDIGPSLGSAVEELPPRAAAWLASHLGINVTPEVAKAASQADWERSIGRIANNRLRFQDVESVLKDLAERVDRLPGSALYALEARAHLLVNDPAAAKKVLERGLASMPITGSPGRQAELLWLHAQAAAAMGELDLAGESLAQAEIVAREVPDGLCRLQIAAQRSILARRGAHLTEQDAAALRTRIATYLAELDEGQLDSEPTLVRVAAAELQAEHWPILRKVVAIVGFGSLPSDAEAALRQALQVNSDSSLDSAFDAWLQKGLGPVETHAAAEAVLAGLRAVGLTLDAANLAGIEQYRESWETDLAAEAMA